MNIIRKGLAAALSLALCIGSSLPAAADYQSCQAAAPAVPPAVCDEMPEVPTESASPEENLQETTPPQNNGEQPQAPQDGTAAESEPQPETQTPAPEQPSEPAPEQQEPDIHIEQEKPEAQPEEVKPENGETVPKPSVPEPSDTEEQGGGKPDPQKNKENKKQTDENRQQGTTITATVGSPSSSYSVMIPEGLELGGLDPAADFLRSYTVKVKMKTNDGSERITVSSPTEFPLFLDGNKEGEQLPAHNIFGTRGTQYFTRSGREKGKIKIFKEDIAKASQGHYEGALNFTILYEQNPGPLDPEQKPSEPEESTAAYYTAKATMWENKTLTDRDVCDGLFARTADIKVQDGKATLSLYIADPMPGLDDPGKSIQNVDFIYNKKLYEATIHNEAQSVMKHFQRKEGFINKAQKYPASIVEVTLPESAIWESEGADEAVLLCDAYINTLSDQDFYIVLDTIGETDGPPEHEPYDPNKPGGGDVDFGDGDDDNTVKPGQKVSAPVSMRNAKNFHKLSMCDGLFTPNAQIEYSADGQTATLTLYVANPIPKFASEGTPLKNISFQYKGKSYKGTLYPAKNKMYFKEKPGFIEPAGDYPASPVVVTGLPVQAIADSAKGGLMCSAYVNAVMKTDVDFYVALDASAPDINDQTDPETNPGTNPDVSPGPAPNPGPAPAPGDNQSYTAAVSMRNAGDFNKYSMCNGLFAPRADIVSQNGMANITLYVADPIPQFPEEGTPVSNVVLKYNGQNYAAQVNSSARVDKSFPAKPGFIEPAGTYKATPVTVQLPLQAIADSVSGKLMCGAYVNAVMHSDVEFFVVFSDLQGGSGSSVPTGPAPVLPPAAPVTPPPETNTAPGETTQLQMDEGEKKYFEASVDMRRADDFNKNSMCDPLFYEKADILMQGETAQLTLYIIDPVPKFAEEGTPLSNTKFIYEGKTYTAVESQDQKVDKAFAAAPGFIPEAGDYPTTPVKVILPKKAIEDSKNKKLKCGTFVNTVMKTDVEFFVVLDGLTETEGPAEEAEKPEEEKEPVPVPAPEGPKGPVILGSKVFPQAIGFVLATVLLLGCAGAVVWMRRR